MHANTQAHKDACILMCMHTHTHKRAHTLTYSTTRLLVLHCFPQPLTHAENASLDYSQLSSFSVERTEGLCVCLYGLNIFLQSAVLFYKRPVE